MVSQMLTEEEYREHPSLNYSKLAAFYNGGDYSPDHALMEFPAKSYFEYGKMFERLLQDKCTGSKEFEERFFFSKVSGKVPDKFIQWIDDGEDLSLQYQLNKNGTRSAKYATLHKFIDEAIEHPGKIPVSVEDAEMLDIHINNMLSMSFKNSNVFDILSDSEWQIPVFWKSDGVHKKALFDCVHISDRKLTLIDLKTTASASSFRQMLMSKYWIQDVHYSDAALNCSYFNDNYQYDEIEFVFLVAYKQQPFLCQEWVIDLSDYNLLSVKYNELICEYSNWDGHPKGWLDKREQRVYV